MNDSFREECGVFGIWNHPEASRMTYLGLYALQHRGQESCGIVTLHEGMHLHHKSLGLVADSFSEQNLDRLKGSAAIGHVRYATTGDNLLTNAQPLTTNLKEGPLALAHNGNIVNSKVLRESLQQDGSIFQGTNDTEAIVHLLARDKAKKFEERLINSLSKIVGAFSLTVLTAKKLIAVRDPMGFRPLSLAKLGESFVVASETCAFDLIGAKFIRDIEPGEVLIIDEQGMRSLFMPKSDRKAQCIFEHVYFSRPDSVVFGKGVYASRKMLGKILAQEAKVNADIVIPVPDSGVAAALGYAEESGIPFDMGIIRNHYIGRTFIEPRQSIRSFGVKIKLNPMSSLLNNKRVIVIDDSLVRGTTSKKIISLIRQAGATEVHLRIAAPPTIGPCYYGVDTPKKEELIASNQSIEKIRDYIGADSLAYLSTNGLFKAVAATEESFCAACFTDRYPTPTKT
ncbi:MAG: amidophosphoribosyltransferase [Oligoflexia bacterium]|nr:amidophosphoribosyltransferase [Oligoflexia bacterium]